MEKREKVALLAGASGLVGSALMHHLLERPSYQRVKVLVRKRLSMEHPKLEQIITDFDRLGEYSEHLQADGFYCCLGTTIKKAGTQEAFRKVDFEYPLTLAKLARDKGAQKFLMITALGADAHSKIFYNRVKGEVEEAVKTAGLPSVHIFRPSLLLGDREEFRLGEKAAVILSPVITFALRGKLRKYRPIPAKDVALAMYAAGQRPQNGSFIYESDQIQLLSKSTNTNKEP